MNEIVSRREIGASGRDHELQDWNIREERAEPRADFRAVADATVGFEGLDNRCDIVRKKQEAAVPTSDVDAQSHSCEVSLTEWRSIPPVDMQPEPAASRHVKRRRSQPARPF